MIKRYLLLALAGSLLITPLLFAETAVPTGEEALYRLLLQGYTWSEPEIQNLLDQGTDPGEALRLFLLKDFSQTLKEGSFLLSDDPHLVVQQLLILMDRRAAPWEDYRELLPAAAENPGFYPLERLKILRCLTSEESKLPPEALEKARAALESWFLWWVQTGEGGNRRSSYRYLADLSAPAGEIAFIDKPRPFSDTDTGILNGQNQVYQIFSEWNKGIPRIPPPDWFRRHGRFQGLMISYNLPFYLNPQGRAVAAELLAPLGKGELSPFNREYLNLALETLKDPPPPEQPEIGNETGANRVLIPPFLSFLRRTSLSDELSLLLPDLPWEEVSPGVTGFTKTLVFGNGGGMKGVYYLEEERPESYNLRKDPRTWNSLLFLPVPPGYQGERRPLYNRMPQVISGPAAMGDLPVERVYFQPFFSHSEGIPDGTDMAVEVRLYIQAGPRWITLGLFSLMNGADPRINAEYLMGECQALLQTARISLSPRPEPELQEAFETGEYDKIIKYLEEGKNPNGGEADGSPLYHRLFSIRDGEERRRLLAAFLEARVNPNAADTEGSRALEKAQNLFDWPSLQLLLENGASGEPAGPGAVPPLVQAALDGDGTTAALLLDHCKIYPDFTDRYGRTALHWAAQGGWTEIAAKLLPSFADPNREDAFGYTPFHWAVMENSTGILPLLKDAGADLTKPQGNTDPVSLALSGGAFEAGLWLKDQGLPVPDRWRAVLEAWSGGDTAGAWSLWGQLKRQAAERGGE